MAPDGQKPSEALAAFHAHLDDCKRCREQPFSLCEAGARILAGAGAAAATWLDAQGERRIAWQELRDSLAGWAKCLGLVSTPEGKGHSFDEKTGFCRRCGADRHGPSLADIVIHVAKGEPPGRN